LEGGYVIRVTIDLIPSDNFEKKTEIGTIDIVNNKTGSFDYGNYNIHYRLRTGEGKGCRTFLPNAVMDFPRQEKDVRYLLFETFAAIQEQLNRKEEE
jgi:hypothetical protein